MKPFATLCLAALLLAPFSTLRAADAMKPTRPNILFIRVDEMKWNVMSCAGHEIVKTPNLDVSQKEWPPVPVMTACRQSSSPASPSWESHKNRNANPGNERKQETLNNEK